MCRWIAYRGETTSFEPYVTEPEHALIAQSSRVAMDRGIDDIGERTDSGQRASAPS